MTGWRRWLAWTALAGLYMIGAGMSGANALQSLGLVVLIGASLPFLPDMLRRFVYDPLAIAVALFFAYLPLCAMNATWEPGSDIIHWDLVRKMSRVLLVPVVAYWLAGRRERIERLCLAVLLGMLAVIAEQIIQWGHLAPLFSDQRIVFRFNPIWMGLNGSLAVIGLIALRRPLQHMLARGLTKPGAFLVWLSLLALMLQVIIASQSRGAYLALFIGLGALALVKVWHDDGGGLTRNRVALGVTVVVIAFIGLLVASQFDLVARRIVEEQETIRRILAGELEGLPTTPIGQRVYMYVAGLDAWMAKPWLGWGPDGAIPAIAQANLPEKIRHDHLHNGPLDVLVRFGIVGALLFYTIPFILLRAGWYGLRDGSLSPACGQFLLAALVTFAAADLTESYLAAGQGWYWLMLIGGAMYTGRLWCAPAAGGRSPAQ